jgi:hypothetical protein
MTWLYNDAEFGSEQAQAAIDAGYIGFVYEITDASNGKKYIGKKLLTSKKKLPPLKGKTRKRVKVTQSDWEKYYGSSETVKTLVETRKSDFNRKILYLCKTKGELSYMEAKEQFDREVLLSDDFYNEFIGVKIHSAHVKNLWKK